MPETPAATLPRPPQGVGLGALLLPYRGAIAGLAVLTIAGNALNLLIPHLVAIAIDSYGRHTLVATTVASELLLAAAGIFVFAYLQSAVQTYVSERVARDLRTRLIAKIAAQDHAYIQQVTPSALLTHLTSDVDAVKMFVAQVIASLISSVFLILGASMLLLLIDWRLALAVAVVLALGSGATLTDPALLRDHLNDLRPVFDIDGNGQADAFTDGLLLLRYLFGLRGESLIAGAIRADATRTAAQDIETYVESLRPQ